MAIFRGTGGSGTSQDDATISAVTEQAGIATTKAGEAAASATAAATSAVNASGSATNSSASASTSSASATTATTKAGEAAASATAAALSASQSATSATAAATSASIANSPAVQTVAGLDTELTSVYNNIDSVTTVSTKITDVSTVAGISADVTTVASDGTDIGIVSANITNVNIVGDDIANINTVALNTANINTVAADASDIGTVAGISSDVSSVANIAPNVTTVSGMETKIDTVIADAADIGTVAANIGSVGTVADITADVTEVAGNTANITTVAANIADVINADANATAAAASAASASTSASNASTSASNAAASATSATASKNAAASSATSASNSATTATNASIAAASSAASAGTSATNAAASAVSASASSVNASNSETAAAGSAGTALLKAAESAASAVESASSAADSLTAANTWTNYYATYLGAVAVAPTLDLLGNPLAAGALYLDTTDNTTYVYTGSAWNAVANNNLINPNVALTQDLATNGNDVKFGDNDKATFGASDDLQIYHDGSHSRLVDSGAGNFIIQAGQFRVNTADDSEAMIKADVDGAVTAYHNGSAKLATTSTGIDVTGTVTNLNESGGSVLNFQQGGSGKAWIANRSYGFHNGSGLAINTTDANPIRFGTNNTEKVRIDSSGNVGIGASSPSSALTVSGSIPNAPTGSGVHLGLASNFAQIQLNGSAGGIIDFSTSGVDSIGRILYDQASDYMRFDTNYAERLRIDSSGRVGIGTSNPEQKLDVLSAGTTRIQVKNTNLTSSGLYIAEDGTGAQINEIGAYPLRFNTNGTERLRIDSSGNLLVGTTSGSRKLEVHADNVPPMRVRRNTSDGNLVEYYKDGTSVGSIGVSSFDLTIQSSAAGHNGLRFGDAWIAPIATNQALDDGTTDLGLSGARFKDLYLSGDVNLANDSHIQFASSACRIEGTSSGSDHIKFITNSNEGFRLDSSGNLLVGKTSGGALGTAGIELRPNNLYVTSDNSVPIYVNRKTSDGTIVDFRKDGTTVGSIGTGNGGNLYIGSGDAGINFNPDVNCIYPINAGNAGGSDGVLDLGLSGVYRFKDLHLSGGVYLGGTGAANKLDDYEEGSFTPVIFGASTAGTGTYSIQSGRYTKTGNKVFIEIVLSWSAHTGTGGMRVSGLPFNTNGTRQAFELACENLTYTGLPKVLNFGNNHSVLQFLQQNSGSQLSLLALDTAVSYIVLTGSYETNL